MNRATDKKEIVTFLRSLRDEKASFILTIDKTLKAQMVVGERIGNQLAGIAGVRKWGGIPILFIVVKSEFQGKHIGTRLLKKLKCMAKQRYHFMVLTVNKKNEVAIRLFLKGGFRICGENDTFIFMVLPLTRIGQVSLWLLKAVFPIAYILYVLLKMLSSSSTKSTSMFSLYAKGYRL